MKFENTQVWGFEHALRGMRNPKNSWKQSDSWNIPFDDPSFTERGGYWIGPKDMTLAQTLIKSGPEHRKFLRQIFVSVDITAPLYWWKEFDTYKVGTVANSTSTMHKLMSKPITYESFEMDDFNESLSVQQMDQSGVTEAGKAVDFKAHWHIESYADYIIEHLEDIRQDYIRWIKAAEQPSDNPDWCAYCKDVAYHLWKELIRWLPESWLQTRTVTMNYENLLAICSKSQRRFHKLNEWSGRKNPLKPNFIAWARTLPYAQDFIFIDELKEESKTQEKSLRQVCSYLIDNKADHVSLKDFGIDLQYEDGTIKSAYIILQELADNINKFDKN